MTRYNSLHYEDRDIVDVVQAGRVRITDHADEEAEADRLRWDDIYASVLCGEIIEEYLADKPYPSCLAYGRAAKGEPVHSVGHIMRTITGPLR